MEQPTPSIPEVEVYEMQNLPPASPQDQPGSGPNVFDYLMTPEGKAVADRLLGVVETIQTATIGRMQKQDEFISQDRRWVLWLQTAVLAIAIFGTVFLSYHDKLNPTVAMLMGTLLGIAVGRRPS